MVGMGDLRAVVEAMSGDIPADLPPTAISAQVAELRSLIDSLEGLWSRMVSALDGSGALDPAVGAAAWLRGACRLSAAEARSRVVLARRLAERPRLDAALVDGAISVGHARLVATALAELEAEAGAELAEATEQPLLDAARRCDPSRLRREIAHARHALVPAAAAGADERLHARRHLDVAVTFEGAVAVSGLLDPEGGELVRAALAPLAAPAGADDDRSPGQRRADALVELSRQCLNSGDLPALGGERPHLTVLVPLGALTGRLAPTAPPAPSAPSAPPTPPPGAAPKAGLRSSGMPATGHSVASRVASGSVAPRAAGLSAECAGSADPLVVSPVIAVGPAAIGSGTSPRGSAVGSGSDPPDLVGGETVWGAVLGPETVRRLACDAAVTRVVLAPASQPLDIGRRTRVIPPAVRTALLVRDRGCVFPGCDRPPPWTDAHHVVHWADGGSTSLDNLVLLCRRHHRAMHEGRHTLTRTASDRWSVVSLPPPSIASA